MEALIWIVTAALIFGICRLVDIGFQKLFRNKAEHLSGKAVRVNKRYGVFGVILCALGIAAIVSQKLYLITGGNIVVELQLENGKTVSLQSTMEGVYPFLDTAFQRWCAQKGLTPEECDFYDPQKSWWFPHEES